MAWDEIGAEDKQMPRGLAWVLVVVRGFFVALAVFGLLIPLMIARLFGADGFAQRIVQFACRFSLWVMGIPLQTTGMPMQHHGIVVANHSSWLDIFSLNAVQKVYFVSKSEVASWPAIGPMARAVGTIFIERDRRRAAAHKALFIELLGSGSKLLFFPEGTSTDGMRVLPFKSTLFSSVLDGALKDSTWVQPVTVNYIAPAGKSPRFYGWWGDMDFAPHLIKALGAWRQGSIHVIFHAPIKVADMPDRKALAKACEEAVRGGLFADYGLESV